MENPEGGQQPVRLVDFPTELLEFIFSYLPGFDKISLSLTCKRFDEVMLGADALRQLNFSGESRLKQEDLKKFLRPLGRCSHVQQFFVDDCYWFSSSFVSSVVSRMKSVTHLRLHGTQLKLRHLGDILKSLKEVTHLSWSWNEWDLEFAFPECQSILERSLPKLVSLRLHLPERYSNTPLVLFLSWCRNLKELILVFVPLKSRPPETGLHFPQPEQISLPLLTSIVIRANRFLMVLDVPIISHVVTAADPNAKWNCFWLDTPMSFLREGTFQVDNTSSLCDMTCEGNAGTFWPKEVLDAQILTLPVSRFAEADTPSLRCSQLKLFQCNTHPCAAFLPVQDFTRLEVFHYLSSSLQLGLTGLYASNTQLTELNLIGYCVCKGDDRSEMCGALSLMTQMRKLALPACYLKGEDPPAAHSEGAAFSSSYSKRRKCAPKSFVYCDANGTASTSTSADTGFSPLVSNCPLVEELELVAWQCKRSTGVRSSEMTPISRWTKLKRLTLYNIPVSDGSFLPTIAESCKDLISLRIGKLGLRQQSSYTPHLLRALKMCSNLQEFWFDQMFSGSMSQLFGALQHCTRLKQLFLDCAGRLSRQDIASLNGLLIKAPDLTCFFCLYESPDGSIKQLGKKLLTKFKVDRPALEVCILKRIEGIRKPLPDLPETHAEMMMCFSRVARGPERQMQ